MAGAGLGAGVKRDDNTASPDRTAANTPAATHRQRSWSDALTTPLRSLVAAASLFSASEEQLKGGIIPDGADDALFRARGAQYAGPITATGGGAVALQISYLDSRSPTGRSLMYASGAIYNERTVITAAHVFMAYPGSILRKVVVGPNYMASDATKYGVEKIVSNPLFTDRDTSRASTFDLAVIVLSEPIQGTLPAKLSTTPLPAGELVMMNGCGKTGTPNTTYSNPDGFFRAGTSLLDNDPIPGESREFYRRAFFQPTARQDDIRGATRDSGGPVSPLDRKEERAILAGLMVSASIDITGRSTGILDLSHPDVQAFIKQHAAYPELPKLSIHSTADALVVSWADSASITLQTSPTPNGPWIDSTTPISVNNGVASASFPFGADGAGQVGYFRLRRRD
jgi:hypothetical protein